MPDNLSGYESKLKVVAVTKGRSTEDIIKILKQTGIKRIGENRLEEAEEKFEKLPRVEKHFLGKLQSRKIKKIVELFDVIQTVENFEQAKRISDCKKEIQVFIQVNISGQANRSGVEPKDLKELIQKVKKLPYLKLEGVM
ncbi:MAG: alanine racemase [Patescibacteria group bacterium]